MYLLDISCDTQRDGGLANNDAGRLLVVATLGLLGALGPSQSALADIEADLDSSGVGGDGVSGQVIGVVTAPGASVVNAVNNTSFSKTKGGDADSANIVRVVDRETEEPLVDQSANSATGDGVGTTVMGAPRVDSQSSGGGEDAFVRFVAFDVGP